MQSFKIKSKLVKIKEDKKAKFRNIEIFIVEEAKKLIVETKSKYEEAYRQLENEGCEHIEEIDRLQEAISTCLKLEEEDKISILQQGNMTLQDVHEYTNNLELDFRINKGKLKSATDKLKDSVYVKSGSLNASEYALEFPEYSGEEGKFSDLETFEIKIRSVHTNTKLSERLMENIVVKMENIDTQEIIEEMTIFDKLKDECVDIVSENPVCLSIKMERPKGCRIRLSSTILKSNTYHSPLLYHFAEEEYLEEAEEVKDSGSKIKTGQMEEETGVIIR